jgi:acetate kinase
MKTLVMNCGLSSLRYQLFDMEAETIVARGFADRIGTSGATLKHDSIGLGKIMVRSAIEDHTAAVGEMVNALGDSEFGVLKDLQELSAIGHRVVHGGEQFSDSVVIDEAVLGAIRSCIPLAPLHNPLNLMGIEASQRLCPGVPQVAVFDTAFHQTMPKYAYLYAIPYAYYEKHKIRRYGFHGLSHQYAALRGAEMVERPIEDLKMVTIHLGNGCSLTAVDGGKSMDTSMGTTPLNGLMMGQRSGDIDPALIPLLANIEKTDADGVLNILNTKSGVLGVSGVSEGMVELEEAMAEGNERAALAHEMFCYRIKKYIGTYAAAMGGLDVVVFTGGIGENDALVRERSCAGLEFMGVRLDRAANDDGRGDRVVSSDNSGVAVLVIPANEELVIARETLRLVRSGETARSS